MEIFGLSLTWFDGLMVALICAIDEWVIKKWICKGDAKYKYVYTFAPIVLSVIAFVVIAIINKTPWTEGLLKGVAIGVATMGSYDAVITIIKGKGVADLKDIGEEVAKTVDKTKKVEK